MYPSIPYLQLWPCLPSYFLCLTGPATCRWCPKLYFPHTGCEFSALARTTVHTGIYIIAIVIANLFYTKLFYKQIGSAVDLSKQYDNQIEWFQVLLEMRQRKVQKLKSQIARQIITKRWAEYSKTSKLGWLAGQRILGKKSVARCGRDWDINTYMHSVHACIFSI